MIFDLNDITAKIEAFASGNDNVAAAYLFGSAFLYRKLAA
jgi:predicted nucleotidyltransferase